MLGNPFASLVICIRSSTATQDTLVAGTIFLPRYESRLGWVACDGTLEDCSLPDKWGPNLPLNTSMSTTFTSADTVYSTGNASILSVSNFSVRETAAVQPSSLFSVYDYIFNAANQTGNDAISRFLLLASLWMTQASFQHRPRCYFNICKPSW